MVDYPMMLSLEKGIAINMLHNKMLNTKIVSIIFVNSGAKLNCILGSQFIPHLTTKDHSLFVPY